MKHNACIRALARINIGDGMCACIGVGIDVEVDIRNFQMLASMRQKSEEKVKTFLVTNTHPLRLFNKAPSDVNIVLTGIACQRLKDGSFLAF